MPDYAFQTPSQAAIPRLYASAQSLPAQTAGMDRQVLAQAFNITQSPVPRLYASTNPVPAQTATMDRQVMVSILNVSSLMISRLYVSQFFPTQTNAPRPRSDVGLLYPAQPS